MSKQDIRWHQRLTNYNKAMKKLDEAMASLDLGLNDNELEQSLSDLEQEGLIQRFEYTHELAWNVMKDYLEYQGNTSISGSRDAVRESFKGQLITEGETWMDMIKSRNETTHTYNEDTADAIFIKVVREYYPLFKDFQRKMEALRSGEEGDIFSREL